MQGTMATSETLVCLACGDPVEPGLAWVASLRCHDCRASHSPIRAELVELDSPRRPALHLVPVGSLTLLASGHPALAA
jgi:hypothetical protein